MFELTDDYRTGIEEIDREHEHLIRIINEFDALLKQGKIDIQMLAKDLLNQLNHYTKTHFKHEEAYMERIHDPELPRQKEEHRDFLQRLGEFPIDDSVKVRDMEEMLDFLVWWLFRHILNSDRMIGRNPAASETENT